MTIENYKSTNSENVIVRELILNREDDDGIVFVSCEAVPDMFIALSEADDAIIRGAVGDCLKSAFSDEFERVQVYTNGRIDGPTIGTMVKLTK